MKVKNKTKEELLNELESLRSKHKRTEERLRSFEKAVETMQLGVTITNIKGKILYSNSADAKMHGYQATDLIGKNVKTFSHKNLWNPMKLEQIKEIISWKRESVNIRKDGSIFPVQLMSDVVTDTTGNPIGIVTTCEDITERKKTEEKIKRDYHIQSTMNSILQIALEPISLEEQLGRILESIFSIPWLFHQSKGSIYLVEDDPHVLVMKAQRGLSETLLTSCEKVPFGRCLCGMAASTLNIVFTDCIDDCHEIRYQDILPHGHYNVPILSGDRVLGVMNLYVREKHNGSQGEEEFLNAVANTLAGIIERNRTELEKQRLKEQLIQAEKLSALGRLTANVAHEIRNPLTSIGGFARRLHKKISSGTKEKDHAEIIVSEVNRLEKILRNVLTYSKKPRLCLESHDIHDIIDKSLRTYEATCKERSIEIQKSFVDIPKIVIDKDHVMEVTNNLISNAIDSMPAGGTLTLSTGKEFLDAVLYLAVKVVDTGDGISEDKLNMIFEPFYSTKVIGRGTGLGLPICKRIMEDHGGFIGARSIIGKGSTFELYFPLKQKDELLTFGSPSACAT